VINNLVSRRSCLVAAVCLTLLPGCSGSKTAPVRGQIVYFDGQPAGKELEGYVITFEAVDGSGGGSGVVDADGTFEISTFKEGDGALLGAQRVAITPPFNQEGMRLPSILSAQYLRLETSGLEVVIEKGVNKVELKVERVR
jgi:hypothetical protein